jgi:uncharacterized membrane protein
MSFGVSASKGKPCRFTQCVVKRGYAWFARVNGKRNMTLIATTNHSRPPHVGCLITQNLSHTPSFFPSTSIIIIGGFFALLGTTDKAAELVREIPFAEQTPLLVFEFKVLVLVGIFVYAFFRFSWSMRQYTFVALVIGAMPFPKEFACRAARSCEICKACRQLGQRCG